MAHRLTDEAGVTRALAIGIRMTPAEIVKGRYMRAPDHGDAPVSRGDAMDAVLDSIVEDHLGGQDEEEELPEGEEPEDDEGEGEEADPDTNDEAGEAQPEPIAAPVSWDKDAKGLFEQLPPELQSKVAEREAQRDKAIQSATTAAAEAKRNAAVEANAVLAESQRQYASHLEHLASQFAPQRPDPALLAQDPQAFYTLQAHYEQQVAQQQELQQRATQTQAEAAQRENLTRQHEIEQTHKVMSEALGEAWTEPTKRQALLTDLETVGAALGYPADLVSQAGTTDLLALKAASEWKAKADKYDKLQGEKMVAVRAAKGLPRVSKPETSATNAEKSSRSRDTAWARVKETRGRSGDDNATYLESIGIKL